MKHREESTPVVAYLQDLFGNKFTWNSNGDVLASIVSDKDCATAYVWKSGTFEVRAPECTACVKA